MREKAKTRKVYNVGLGTYEWMEVKTDKYVFEESARMAIAREYLEKGCPACEIVSRHKRFGQSHKEKQRHKIITAHWEQLLLQ